MSDFENKSKMNTSYNYMKEEKLLGRNHYQCQISGNVRSHKECTCTHTNTYMYTNTHS